MNKTKPLVIVLLGPTASGKTNLAIEIAEELKLDIHNVDSRQIYKGMDIGTAKPTQEQQNRVKHYLIDLYEPNEPITLQQFQNTAQQSLEKEIRQKNMSLLTGGSGLYIKSLTAGLQPPAVPPQKKLREQLLKFKKGECYQFLQRCDPETASKLPPTDSNRIIRALEVFYATGKPFSTQLKSTTPSWKVLEIGLNPLDLNERIIKRTKQIYKNGLIEETENLIRKFGQGLQLLKTIGYQEALSIINGDLNQEEAIATTTLRTKQLAKRQKTWFRNKHNPKWLNNEQPLRESLSLIKDALR